MLTQNTNSSSDGGPLILVVEDVEETRDGIELLLKTDGYRVAPARTVAEAVRQARRQAPDLLLLCLAGTTAHLIQAAHQIREEAGLTEERLPIVIFCIEEVASGEEVAIGRNVYLTQLDNFDQLRVFLRRLLSTDDPLVPTY